MAKQPQITVENITPEKAKAYLAFNTNNRNLRPKLVEKYARDMRAGKWLMTGDGIKFSTDGKLSDGQHRLAAIVESKTTVQMIVVRNVEPEAQDVMDTGAGRKLGDVLKLRNEKHAAAVAGVLRPLWYFQQFESMVKPNPQPSNAELLRILDDHPNIRYAVIMGRHVQNEIKNFNSSCVASLYLMQCVDFFAAEEFAIGVKTGAELTPNDPRLALRKVLMRYMNAPHKPKVWFNGAWLTKAWNSWRSGESKEIISWRPPGEKWPWPDGLRENWYRHPLVLPPHVAEEHNLHYNVKKKAA